MQSGRFYCFKYFRWFILQSAAEFRKFLGYAIRSLAEVVTCLYKAKRRDYIEEENLTTYIKKALI